MIGTAANGKDYAVKTMGSKENHFIPASELFCYELARYLHIATPEWQYIEMSDGKIAFGSQWEGGSGTLADFNELLEFIMDETEKPGPKIRDFTEFLAKVYALDIFVNNIDRHVKNILIRTTFNDAVIALAYDFGQAWYVISPFTFEVLGDCNTTGTMKFVKRYGKLDIPTVTSTLDNLCLISKNVIESIFTMIPTDWLPENEKSEFIEWWGGNDMQERINELKAHVSK